MKTFLILIIPALSLLHCDKKTDASQNPDARELVNNFYTWYITDAYKNTLDFYQVPPYKKLNDSTYIFDKDVLKARLDKIPFFSEAYKKSMLDRLEGCNAKMVTKRWDAEPESQFNIKECNYLWFDNWVGGQGENIDGFKIVNEDTSSAGVDFTVDITIKGKLFTKSKVNVVKEDGRFTINNIELIWK